MPSSLPKPLPRPSTLRLPRSVVELLPPPCLSLELITPSPTTPRHFPGPGPGSRKISSKSDTSGKQKKNLKIHTFYIFKQIFIFRYYTFRGNLNILFVIYIELPKFRNYKNLLEILNKILNRYLKQIYPNILFIISSKTL